MSRRMPPRRISRRTRSPATCSGKSAVFRELRDRVERPSSGSSPRSWPTATSRPASARPRRLGRDWEPDIRGAAARRHAGGALLLHGLTDAPYSMRTIAEPLQRAGYTFWRCACPGTAPCPAASSRPRGRTGWRSCAWGRGTCAAHRRRAAAGARRLFERRGAGREVRARRRRGRACPRRPPGADLADDRRLARSPPGPRDQPLGAVAVLREGALAGHRAGIQPVQVQLVSRPTPGCRPTASRRVQRSRPRSAKRPPDRLPPILAFQSIVDTTVSTRPWCTTCSTSCRPTARELVVFDINRLSGSSRSSGRPARPAAAGRGSAAPYRRTWSPTPAPTRSTWSALTVAPAARRRTEPLGLAWPADMFSLSHVALPFPPTTRSTAGNVPQEATSPGSAASARAARGRSWWCRSRC